MVQNKPFPGIHATRQRAGDDCAKSSLMSEYDEYKLLRPVQLVVMTTSTLLSPGGRMLSGNPTPGHEPGAHPHSIGSLIFSALTCVKLVLLGVSLCLASRLRHRKVSRVTRVLLQRIEVIPLAAA